MVQVDCNLAVNMALGKEQVDSVSIYFSAILESLPTAFIEETVFTPLYNMFLPPLL